MMAKTTTDESIAEPAAGCAYTPDEVADAIQRAHGIPSLAAQILGCERRLIFRYKECYPEVELAYSEARDATVDLAENKQLKALNEGRRWAIENWLFCSKEGRERGWLRRAEQTSDINLLNAIQIIEIPDNTRDAGMVTTVNVEHLGDDGDVRTHTYPVTREELAHQKQIGGILGHLGTPRGADTAWLLEAEENENGEAQ